MLDQALFDGWGPLGRTLLVGVLAYAALVLLLRVTGRRSLSKMNAFDFVVTVALGSTLASLITSKDIALAQGVLAFALLLGLQYAVTWTSVRLAWFRRMITGEPALLFHRGDFLPEAMRRARVTREEIRAALRQHGHADLQRVHAVVLETDGSFSVLGDDGAGAVADTLGDVQRPGPGAPPQPPHSGGSTA